MKKDKALLMRMRDNPCHVCGGHANNAGHHLRTKGSGGSDVLSNLITLCFSHHREIHDFGMITFMNAYPHVKKSIMDMGWEQDETTKKWFMNTKKED